MFDKVLTMKKARSASFSTNEEIDKLIAEHARRTSLGRSGVLKLAMTEYAERHRTEYRPTPGQIALLLALGRFFKEKPNGLNPEERFKAMAEKYEKMVPHSNTEPQK
jgi:hypothetical protein